MGKVKGVRLEKRLRPREIRGEKLDLHSDDFCESCHYLLVAMVLSCEEFGYVIFSLVFPVLYTRGPPWVQFYTKFFLYYASLTLSASVVLPFTVFRPKDPRNLLWPQYLMRQTASLLGLKYSLVNELQAKKRLCFKDEGSASVVVVNHQSSLDVLGLLCHLWPLMD